MTAPGIDVEAVLADLKDFQRRTARWAFERMFHSEDPATRFLVADEVGLGKTHVARGVVAQVIDHLRDTGDARHDIVYVCSNAAIARQNLRKLAPAGIAPTGGVDRLTMLPLVRLDGGRRGQPGVNLLAITPGTSLKFGRSTGRFKERCLAYAFLRAHWGAEVMTPAARRIFWEGVTRDPDYRLCWWADHYRAAVDASRHHFAEELAQVDHSRVERGRPKLRELFERVTEGLTPEGDFPGDLWGPRCWLIATVRRIMATVGIAALQPDLVILDEFQRFKDLLRPNPGNFAANLAHRMFNYRDPKTGRATRALLLSATPYRMYTTGDEPDADHYRDFLQTCSFLFEDETRTERLKGRFVALRLALTSPDSLGDAEAVCGDIGAELSGVMARTERLAATPDRDGMLTEPPSHVAVKAHDLRAYLRFGNLAAAVRHHEPVEYWKSAPYLVNFMESYKLKEGIAAAAADGHLGDRAGLEAGPGLLSWEDVEAYDQIDPQNGRLRWLLDDLGRHRAFELLWIPPSLRYYDTGSPYESPEAAGFTKRLIFSGWAVVPKVVSSMVSFEAERRAYAGRSHAYTADYRRRGGQRLTFRTTERKDGHRRPGEAAGDRRAAAMSTFGLIWPSPSLAVLGDPRPQAPAPPRRPVSAVAEAVRRMRQGSRGGRLERRHVSEVLDEATARIEMAVDPLVAAAPRTGPDDRRWYWAAPLLLDKKSHPSATSRLLEGGDLGHWEGARSDSGLRAHVAEAQAMLDAGAAALGRPPKDLPRVLAEMALGGPAQCALRAISSVCGLPVDHEDAVSGAARAGGAFRGFFNAPEVTGLIAGASPRPHWRATPAGTDLAVGARRDESDDADADEGDARYWRDVLRHSIDGNLQAVLDEHCHILRDWLGYLSLGDDARRAEAARDIAHCISEALDLRTSTYRVDIPRRDSDGNGTALDARRMRSRFAVAFGNQTLDEGGEARIESVSRAFNSPFWPFVLTSTSIGQEGLDFHLWCHAVVHWNLPANPVDLEQREGRVHRYKGHAVRRNVAATHGPGLLAAGLGADDAGQPDLWRRLFERAAAQRPAADGEMVPYWVFHEGPAKIERHMPVMPFSSDAAALPRMRKALAAYRLAFGQPRQEELVEFLGAGRSDEELQQLAGKLRIDLSPPGGAAPAANGGRGRCVGGGQESSAYLSR